MGANELAGCDPGGNLADGLRISGGIVEHDHPFHARPVDQEPEVVARSFDRRRVVVLGDGAAYDDAGMPSQLREGNIEYVATDIVEIHVDARGASAQARYSAGTREILECFYSGRPIREEYLIARGGRL